MQKITTETGHTIELYDSIDEMPMVRYQRYNQLMVLGVGASTDINDIRRKIATIGKMIDADMAKEAKVELNNLNMQMVVTAASIDTRSRAFACLVKSIDGKPCDDITADGIKRTAEYLDTILTKGERDTTNDGVKKKIESEIKYYYPERSVEDHAQMNTMKRRLELVLDEIIEGVSKEEQIATIDLRLLRYATVIDYGEYERTSDVAFEQGCLSIQEQLHKDPKTMSVMEYMAATKMLEERSRKLEQIQNKHKK